MYLNKKNFFKLLHWNVRVERNGNPCWSNLICYKRRLSEVSPEQNGHLANKECATDRQTDQNQNVYPVIDLCIQLLVDHTAKGNNEYNVLAEQVTCVVIKSNHIKKEPGADDDQKHDDCNEVTGINVDIPRVTQCDVQVQVSGD